MVHGNAGYAVHRAVYADALQRAANVDVCVLEYPGYGFRDGDAREASFCAAADEAVALRAGVDFIFNDNRINFPKVFRITFPGCPRSGFCAIGLIRSRT